MWQGLSMLTSSPRLGAPVAANTQRPDHGCLAFCVREGAHAFGRHRLARHTACSALHQRL